MQHVSSVRPARSLAALGRHAALDGHLLTSAAAPPSPAVSDKELPSVAVSSPMAAASLRSRATYPSSGQPCAAAPPSRRVFWCLREGWER